MDVVTAAGSGAFGLLIGSWLHVLVARTPIHQPLRRPGAHCTTCGSRMARIQRVAIIALFTPSRNCDTCRNRLWPDSPWLEIVTIIVLATAGLRLGWGWALPAYLVFFAAIIVITLVDLRLYVIPNRVVYPALFLGLGMLTVAAAAGHDARHLATAVMGMAGAWLFFFVVWFAYPKGMGFGDVRLAALIGLLAGWLGLGNVVQAVMLGLLLGAVVGVLLIVLRLRTRKQAIPFGPFLAGGGALAILFGSDIAQWWQHTST